MILSVQLVVTAIFVALSVFKLSYKQFLQHNVWLLYVAIVLSLASMYSMIYVRSLARTVPINFILLAVFTLSESYLVSSITMFYDPQTILIATVLTATIVLALTVYAFTTKTDFTVFGGILFVVLSVVFVASIFCFMFPSKLFRIILSGVSVILFSFYLIYDTQLILGRGELKLGMDDYIFAALNLYLDILNIFLDILRIVSAFNN